MSTSAVLAELSALERILELGADHLDVRVVCEVAADPADPASPKLPVHAITLGNASLHVPAAGFFGGVHGLERIGAEVVIAYLQSLVTRMRWDSTLHRQL